MEVGGNTTVHTEKLGIDDGSDRQLVEQLHEAVVHLLVVLGQACMGEGVHSVLKLK